MAGSRLFCFEITKNGRLFQGIVKFFVVYEIVKNSGLPKVELYVRKSVKTLVRSEKKFFQKQQLRKISFVKMPFKTIFSYIHACFSKDVLLTFDYAKPKI